MSISPESILGLPELKAAIEASSRGEANLAAEHYGNAFKLSPELRLFTELPEMLQEVDPRLEPRASYKPMHLLDRHIDLSVPRAAMQHFRSTIRKV